MSEEYVDLLHPYIVFKDEKLGRERALLLSPQAIEIMNDMADWCHGHWLPFVVTDSVSTPGEDRQLKRMSSTHREGRAFDISIRGWMGPAIDEFCSHYSKVFKHVAATNSRGEPQLVVRHDNGNGDHIHVQIAKVFGLKDPFLDRLTT